MEPKRTSDVLGFSSFVVLFLYGSFFVFWFSFGAQPAYTNYFLIAVPFALSLLGWYSTKFDWLYGLDSGRTVRPHQRDRSQVASVPVDQVAPPADVARREMSTLTFADIQGNKEIKRRLLDAAMAITASKGSDVPKRNGILLFGEPGNGKTVFAEALAGELKMPILKLTHSDVASRWVGERTEKIAEAFQQAARTQPCVLFIDEIDSFLPDRSGRDTQTKEDTDVVNSLLTLMVDVRKLRVVLVAATNYVDRLDGAAIREGRFDFKVEITPPDEEARIGLLTSGLKKNVRKADADQATIVSVAQRWNGYSVKRILAVTEELPSYLADLQQAGTPRTRLEFEDFMASLRRIQGRKGAAPENVKPMSELILSADTREALSMLSNRMRDPQRVERLGGTLPSGVLFYGPPGTGKTAAVKALAKEVDWAFLVATGNDLARDPKALEQLYVKAKELRPCIIFIDEADDLIRSRAYATNSEATNKLLTLMDGVSDRVKDLVWVAATNHPDQIDTALLRGGRFTEKVEFARPDGGQLETHIGTWLSKRKVGLQAGLSARNIAELLGDQSIANTEAVLQYAVNRAINRSTTDESVVLSEEDVRRGASMVLGEVA
ncbi:MAG: AAA family ATPase [Rhodoferax sp.]|nr:AAA family ATPase [Rhodoferax sp.]